RKIQFRGGDPMQPSRWQVTLLAGDISSVDGTRGTMDGTGSAARFLFPEGLSLDRAGNVYVADTASNRVRKIAPGGVVTTLAGGISGDAPVSGYADGPAVTGGVPVARFSSPSGIAVDSAGFLYVADEGNNRI